MEVAGAHASAVPLSPWATSSRLPVRAAAMVSVAAVVGLDVAGGAGAAHVGALAVLAVLVSVLRVHLAGRHQLLFGFLSAVLVLQPAAHLVEQAGATSGPHLDAAADWSASSAHLLVAVGLAVAVGSAEFHFTHLERCVGHAIWLLAAMRRPRPDHAVRAVRPPAHDQAPQLWERVGYVARRGPPLRSARGGATGG